MPAFHTHAPAIETLFHRFTPHCPLRYCDGMMRIHPETERLRRMGLTQVQCHTCHHRGFRSIDGVQVLFGGRHEYVCGYGPSSSVLTIIFSEAALSLFLDTYLSPTEAARYAAYWALLRGHVAGRVNLIADSPLVSECYGHFCREYEALSRNSDEGDCKHDYQLETVGGVFLTGASVCRLCSGRVGMSKDQFHQHAEYPRHYQDNTPNAASKPAHRRGEHGA